MYKNGIKQIVDNLNRLFLQINPVHRRIKERISSLKGKYINNRCVIVGNGPSLNKMDLEIFKNEYVWMSNKAYLLFDRISWVPSFFIAVDRRVVPDISDNLQNLTKEYRETLFFFSNYFRKLKIIRSHNNIIWFNDKREHHMKEGSSLSFSLDPTAYVNTHSTVTIAAIQLAVFMGFNPIYLIGCDTSYSIPSTVIKDENQRTLLLSTKNDDPNHFVSNYFGKGNHWQDPNVSRMIEHYQVSNLVCKSIDVKIYNATVGGKLEVFPRVNYMDIFA